MCRRHGSLPRRALRGVARRRRRIQPFNVTLLSAIACTSFALSYFFPDMFPGTLSRFVPRVSRELRRHLFVDWARVLVEARNDDKFQLGVKKTLEVRIISLTRTIDRSHKTLEALTMQGIEWKLQTAFDGLLDIDADVLQRYAGRKKYERIQITLGLPRERLIALKEQYDNSKYVDLQTKRALHERLRFGCFMSHVKLWTEVSSTNVELMIILEDDVNVVPNFLKEATSRIKKLPKSWDVMYLGGCYRKYGPEYVEGIFIARGGLCTFGYVISAKGAHKLLQSAIFRSEKAIDHVLDYELLSGHLLGFHAHPPLVMSLKNIKSTLAY